MTFPCQKVLGITTASKQDQQILVTTATEQKRIGERCLSLVLNKRSRVHVEAEDIAQSQNKYLLGLQSRHIVPA